LDNNANLLLDDQDDVTKEQERAVDAFEKHFTLRDRYEKIIRENLPKNFPTFKRYVAKFREKHTSVLQTPYPYSYPIFTKADKDIIFDTAGIEDQEAYREAVAEIEVPAVYSTVRKSIKKDKAIHVLSIFMLRELMISKASDNDIAVLLYYIGYSFYWEKYTVFFPTHLPDKRIVEYTINSLSKRYAIRACGNVDLMIFHGMQGCYNTYKSLILEGADYPMLYVSDKMDGRLRGYIRSFADPIHKNSKNKQMILTSKQIDEEGKQIDTESKVTLSLSLADKFTTHFISSPPSEKWINFIAKQNGININDLRNTIYIIKKDDYNNINKFYQAMFYIFLVTLDNEPQYLTQKKYIVEMNKVYRKGNSNDKNIELIKSSSHKWLMQGSATYKASNRAETLNKFKRSIFEYFVYTTVSK
jgi:hypothetical protein